MQPVPPTGTTYQISRNGFHPWWTRDGKQIVYVQGFGRLWSVDVTTQPAFKFGAPVSFPRGFNEKLGSAIGKHYDVMPDGRLIGLAAHAPDVETVPTDRINVVVNWLQELKQHVPVK